jgi:orotate phosphoribosyltransferase
MKTPILKYLRAIGAIDTNGHYKLASGKHSNAYIDLRVGLSHLKFIRMVGAHIGRAVKDLTQNDVIAKPNFIVGFGNAGPLLAYSSAMSLSSAVEGLEIIWCVADGDTFAFPKKMPFAQIIKEGSKAIIVDDLLTSGGSIARGTAFLESLGVEVLAAVVAISRNHLVTAKECGVPLLHRIEEIEETQIKLYDEETCPLCREKVPMRRGVAHNDEFLKNHPNFPTK